MASVPSHSISHPPSPSSSSSCCPPSCPSCSVPLIRRAWDRCTSSTYGVKFSCIVIMLECAFIALTGRGVISILQAIVGVIFAIEGFWGAVRFDRPSIKRFLIFLVCDFLAGIAIAILDLETVDAYCDTADSSSDESNCRTKYHVYAIVLLCINAASIPVFFFITTLFYLKLLSVHQAQRERGLHPGSTGFGGVGGAAGGSAVWPAGHRSRAGKYGGIGFHYAEGDLLGADEEEEEEGYAGTLVQGDVDQAKQVQVRAELAVMRGDEEEISDLQARGSVLVRESDEEEDDIVDHRLPDKG